MRGTNLIECVGARQTVCTAWIEDNLHVGARYAVRLKAVAPAPTDGQSPSALSMGLSLMDTGAAPKVAKTKSELDLWIIFASAESRIFGAGRGTGNSLLRRSANSACHLRFHYFELENAT